MRPLAATLALVLFAAACSLPGPASMGAQALALEAVAMLAPTFAVDGEGDSEQAPQREDGDAPGDAGETSDDLDGDDGDLLGMLRPGSPPELLSAALICWEVWVDRVVFDHAPSDLIRPPIRA